MARTVKLPEGHTALTPADMDRFSVGPDKKLYLDNERVATKSLFERPMARVLAVVTAGVTILGGAAVLADTVLAMNDRYCWWAGLYSRETQCSDTAASKAPAPDSKTPTPADTSRSQRDSTH